MLFKSEYEYAPDAGADDSPEPVEAPQSEARQRLRALLGQRDAANGDHFGGADPFFSSIGNSPGAVPRKMSATKFATPCSSSVKSGP